MEDVDRIAGCLLGTALGDAVGLPYEGLSPGRAARLLGPPTSHRFFLGRGMVSDDTEHTRMVMQAWIASAGRPDVFEADYARRLRHWLLGLPAGVGFATARAILRLWIGFPPSRSGVFSAGNGPAMRAAPLGVLAGDMDALRSLVTVSTRLTHTDPRALQGALAIALAARCARDAGTLSAPDYLARLDSLNNGEDGELARGIRRAAASAGRGEATERFAHAEGYTRGVSGYVCHTVPVALHACLAHPHDFRAAVTAVIACGGDADTTAAIVGGIVGAAVGRKGLPEDWLDSLMEWPASVRWMERLAQQAHDVVATARALKPLRLPLLPLIARNAFFLACVLGHGFRRLAPPYGSAHRP